MIELSESEQVVYLANVILLVDTNSLLSLRELASLEYLRSKIGAKKKILNVARKAVESGTYTLSKCGGFAIQVNNLSDMLDVCFVDGKFSDKERVLASGFSKSIGLTESQFELMVKNSSEGKLNLLLTVSCPNCSTTAFQKTKFYTNCGTPLVNIPEEPVKTDFIIPKTGHVIEFPESSSSNFPEALEIAKESANFKTYIRNKKKWYRALWPEESFDEIANLLTNIRYWKYYHNGSEVPSNEFRRIVGCAKNRNSAYRPIEYCFGEDEINSINFINPWGCKYIHLTWTVKARWFSYGQFKKSRVTENSYTWVFDKERIRHEVMRILHYCRWCPYIRPDLIEAVLNALPEEVEISTASGWEYNRVFKEVPGSIKIVEINKYSGYESKIEYYAYGVNPIGMSVLRQILKIAFTEANITDLKVEQLVKLSA